MGEDLHIRNAAHTDRYIYNIYIYIYMYIYIYIHIYIYIYSLQIPFVYVHMWYMYDGYVKLFCMYARCTYARTRKYASMSASEHMRLGTGSCTTQPWLHKLKDTQFADIITRRIQQT